MYRLFFTSEHHKNTFFKRVIGFQPSFGWMILDEDCSQMHVFLDQRYSSAQSIFGDHVCWEVVRHILDRDFCLQIASFLYESSLLKYRSGQNTFFSLLVEEGLSWMYVCKIEDELSRFFDVLVGLPSSAACDQRSLKVNQQSRKNINTKTPSDHCHSKEDFEKKNSEEKYIDDKQQGNKLLGIEMKAVGGDFQDGLRTIKSSSQRKTFSEAWQKALMVRDRIKMKIDGGELIGKTELEVRGMLIHYAMSQGFEGEAFDTIVSFGRNSAIPHYQTGRTVLQDGPLLIDMGWIYNGMCTDMSRTVRIGERTAEYKKFQAVVENVQEAFDCGVRFALDGMSCHELSESVRDILRSKNLEQYFIHSLGHGVGVEVHEYPTINTKSDATLRSGMIVTIEPGVYFPGEFGVRWEDTIVVG